MAGTTKEDLKVKELLLLDLTKKSHETSHRLREWRPSMRLLTLGLTRIAPWNSHSNPNPKKSHETSR